MDRGESKVTEPAEWPVLLMSSVWDRLKMWRTMYRNYFSDSNGFSSEPTACDNPKVLCDRRRNDVGRFDSVFCVVFLHYL